MVGLAKSDSEENKSRFKQVRDLWCSTASPTEEAMMIKTGSFGGPEAVGEATYRSICENWRRRHAGSAGYDPAMHCLAQRDSILEDLEKIQVPVLIMHGTQDAIYAVEQAQTWAKKLPNVVDFVVVEGGFHYLSYVSPGKEACAKAVPGFVKAHE